MRIRLIVCFVFVSLALTLSGCTGSAPVNGSSDTGSAVPSQDLYREAFTIANEYHYYADADFNNGTIAWEAEDYRQAIADYANSSREYDEAAEYYQRMVKYAPGSPEREFATLMQACVMNMSKSADAFMESAIFLTTGDNDRGAEKFDEGQKCAYESGLLLNRSADVTPVWMRNLSSG